MSCSISSTFPSTIAPASCTPSYSSQCTPQCTPYPYSSLYGGGGCTPYGGYSSLYGGGGCTPYGGGYGGGYGYYGGGGSPCRHYGGYGNPYKGDTTPQIPGMPFVNPGGHPGDTRYIDGKKCRRTIKLRPLF